MSVNRYMHPFAMKGLQKMCIFLSKWYKCVLEGDGPQDGTSPFKTLKDPPPSLVKFKL